MIPGFEEGLMNLKEGDTTTMDLQFPEDYHHKEIAGKPIHFKATVKKVREPHYPELNDEFANKAGVKDDAGLEGLKGEIRGNLTVELDKALKNKNKQTVMDKILELTPLEVPNTLVKREIGNMKEQSLHSMMRGQKHDLDPNLLPDEPFKDEALRRIKLGLIFSQYMKEHELKPNPEEVREHIENIAKSYQKPEQIVSWYYNHEESLEQVQSLVLENDVVEKIFSDAKITESQLSYTEAMEKTEDQQ